MFYSSKVPEEFFFFSRALIGAEPSTTVWQWSAAGSDPGRPPSIMTSSAGLQTHQCWKPQCLHSPFLHLVLPRAPVPSSSPPHSCPPPHPPLAVLFHLPLKPPVVILASPLPAHPTFSSPLPTPLVPPFAPLFPISVSVCSYPADLCPSCRCWFAHPAPLANMTKRDPQYSNRHSAFKCRMAGSTWVQL